MNYVAGPRVSGPFGRYLSRSGAHACCCQVVHFRRLDTREAVPLANRVLGSSLSITSRTDVPLTCEFLNRGNGSKVQIPTHNLSHRVRSTVETSRPSCLGPRRTTKLGPSRLVCMLHDETILLPFDGKHHQRNLASAHCLDVLAETFGWQERMLFMQQEHPAIHCIRLNLFRSLPRLAKPCSTWSPELSVQHSSMQ